jgi:sugar phosphate isomerase/epimerase
MARIARRDFLGALATSTIAPKLARGRSPDRLPIAFSTLGCPAWDWRTILQEAEGMGYAAVELRGIQGDLDLPRRPEFQGSRLTDSLGQIAGRGLRIASLGSSAAMHEPDPVLRAGHLDEARRFIDLAQALGAPYVRVFPNNFVAGEQHDVTIERIAEGLRTLGRHAEGSGVSVLVESHGDFTHSADLLEVLTAVGMTDVAFLWDAHHTVVSGHEAPAETFRVLAAYVRHTHLKDSRPDKDGVRYVLTGQGTVPVEQTVKTLVTAGYRGYFCFEWEKKWHPELEEPEVAFPHYARTMAGYLAAAGVKA